MEKGKFKIDEKVLKKFKNEERRRIMKKGSIKYSQLWLPLSEVYS